MEEKEFRIYDCVPYQKCPQCNGIGEILADGFIANSYQECNVCHGEKIIPMYIISIPFHDTSDN